jgi:hypothetical protein
MVFNTSYNKITAILWQSVLLVGGKELEKERERLVVMVCVVVHLVNHLQFYNFNVTSES